MKTYSELIKLLTFEERFQYLRLDGTVGKDTFGFDRYLNQRFYASPQWKQIRDSVIIRDNGCDLAIGDRMIFGRILVHHMNPISAEDICCQSDLLTNPEYLICVSHDTHNAIHYGDENQLVIMPPERKPGDTCPWKR